MAHLTLGELTQRTVIRDHRNAGRQRLLEIRAQPGYGPAALRKYRGVLPDSVFNTEADRLRTAQDRAAAANPLAFAYLQLKRAYEADDIPAIRRWERAVTTAGGRRYLRAVQARSASYRQRGISGMGCFTCFAGLG